MAELSLGILIVGVILVTDPDRLQILLDRLRDLINWLAE
jgi:hypothetical protein